MVSSLVVKYQGANTSSGEAGEPIEAGQALYRELLTGRLKKANTSSSEKAACVGIALNPAALYQPVMYITRGGLNPGALVVVGLSYGVSSTLGAISPLRDLEPGEFGTLIGFGATATRLEVDLKKQDSPIAG